MDYFITTGEVDDDYPFVLVGRKGLGKIRLSKYIEEYSEVGRFVHIDSHGNPWVKK